MDYYDVAVVGAGPSGCACARITSKAGLKTVIIEKFPLPRYKPCTGYLIPESIAHIKEHFGEPPSEVFASPGYLEIISMNFPSGRRLDIPVEGWLIWRDRFDWWLCQSSGAEVMSETSLVSFQEDEEGVVLNCVKKNGEEVKIRAQVMVGADGGPSRIVEQLDPGARKSLQWFIVAQELYSGRCDFHPGWYHFFAYPEFNIHSAGFLKDEIVVLELGVPLGEKMGPHWERFKDFLKKEYKFRPEKLLKKSAIRLTFGVQQGYVNFGTSRVLVVGEASGLLNMYAEGISSALGSGLSAGKAIVKAIKEELDPGEVYRQEVEPERLRTARQFSLYNQIFGVIGSVDYKKGLARLPFFQRLLVMKDLTGWVLYTSSKKKHFLLPSFLRRTGF